MRARFSTRLATRAGKILQSVARGTILRDRHSIQASAAAAEAAADVEAAEGPRASPYVATTTYPERYVTSESNPAHHTFAHAGRYFSLGEEAAARALVPGGWPGDVQSEFDTTYATALQVRPDGVWLVAHLEHWRQVHGRRLAGQGKPVLDIDPTQPYTPKELHVPKTAFADAVGSDTMAYSDPRLAKFHPARVVVGPPGSGKSGVLSYALFYARTNGWLALCVPDCFKLMYMGKVLVKSKRRPGMVDQHDMALDILRDVLNSQEGTLTKLPQRSKYAKFRYLPRALDAKVTAERDELRQAEEAEKARLKAKADAEGGSWDASTFDSKYEDETDMGVDRSSFTLQDMVAWGIAHPAAAVDTLLDLLAELRVVTEVPVLILADGANHLYGRADYAVDGEDLKAEQLSIASALRPFTEEGFHAKRFSMKRGVWLLGVSFKHHQNMDATLFGTARVAGSVRLPIRGMTRVETYAMLRHYKACGSVTTELPEGTVGTANRFLMLTDEELPEVDASAVEFFRMISGGRPGQVKRAAAFTPDPEAADSLKKMRERREARKRIVNA